MHGAIILCGGESKRMGRDKNWLPFGPHETMLQRVVRIVGEAVPTQHIVCIAAPDQQLPALPADVRVVRDAQPHAGPLAGLAKGLSECSRHTPCAATEFSIDAVFATGCDTPLLVPAFITRLFDLLGNHEVAAPHDGEHWHPLASVYRTSTLPQVKSLLTAGQRSLVALLESADTRRVPTAERLDVDPQLSSLLACNRPSDYQSALRVAGFPAELI